MDFLPTLGHDETFWVGMATVQAALMIALAVEGRTAREQWDVAEERLDHDLDERTRQAEVQWKKRAQDERVGIARETGPRPAPPLVLPRGSDPNQPERAGRIVLAVLALPALALGLVSSLFAMSPIAYPGAVVMAFAATVSAASVLVAIWALSLLAVRRMTGRTVRGLMATLRQRRHS